MAKKEFGLGKGESTMFDFQGEDKTNETIAEDYPIRQNDDNEMNYELEEAVSSGSSNESNEDHYSLEQCTTVDQLQPKLLVFIESM